MARARTVRRGAAALALAACLGSVAPSFGAGSASEHAGAPGASPPRSPASDARWVEPHAPAAGPAEAIGSYARGCLRGAVAMPAEGPGFIVMRAARSRYYGHPNLVSFVTTLGARALAKGLPIVYVGDLSQARGGPTPTGHASHQTGLDVDVWFVPPKSGPMPPDVSERETIPSRALVDLATGKLTSAFRPSAFALLELAAREPNVDRIFVHPTLKKKLCVEHKGEAWAARVRPWWGHEDHFHVRLACPKDNPSCEAQPPVTGDGCDAGLEWWFSAEAKAGPKKDDKPPKPLPNACEAVLCAGPGAGPHCESAAAEEGPRP
jgi:penicillin-insensitive murein endopeptidase